MAEFTQAIVDWLQSIFHNNFLVTAVISVIPMIEVRGAITVGNNLGMNPWYAYLLSCCSALLVCPILLLCLKPILNALKKTKPFRNFAVTVEETFRSRAEMIENNAEKPDQKIRKPHRKKCVQAVPLAENLPQSLNRPIKQTDYNAHYKAHRLTVVLAEDYRQRERQKSEKQRRKRQRKFAVIFNFKDVYVSVRLNFFGFKLLDILFQVVARHFLLI